MKQESGIKGQEALASRKGRVAVGHPSRKAMEDKDVRVAVGLSGGVDSSVAAALLVEAGYEVTGVFLECWRAPGCRVDEDRKDAMDVAMKLKIPFKVLDFKKTYKQKVVDYFRDEYLSGRTPNPDVMCNREIKFGMFYEWAMRLNFDYVATGHYSRIRKVKSNKSKVKNTSHKLKVKQELRIENKESRYTSAAGSLDVLQPKADGRDEGKYVLMRGKDTKKDPHFAKASRGKQSYVLMKGLDVAKDQSYFLYQLREEQLAHVLFPLGEMTKSKVREKAVELGLHVADKPDSQGICFVGPVAVEEFLKDLGVEEKRGRVFLKLKAPRTSRQRGRQSSKLKDTTQNSKVTQESRVRNQKLGNAPSAGSFDLAQDDEYLEVGIHRGVWFYTVGQRIGVANQNSKLPERQGNGAGKTQNSKYIDNLKVAGLDPSHLPPLYVVEKDVTENVLVVGMREQVMRDEFEVEELHMVDGRDPMASLQDDNLRVRIRHGGALMRARITNQESGIKIRLDEPVFGVAPGQAAVFYEGDMVLGGGVIG